MSDTDFIKEKQRAIERMMALKNSSSPGVNPFSSPSFVKMKGEDKPLTEPHKKEPFPLDFSGLDFPFLDRLKKDKDMGLILGLILLLVCENADRLTLIALLYILL